MSVVSMSLSLSNGSSIAIGRERPSVLFAWRRDRDDGLRFGLRELRAVHIGGVAVVRDDDDDDDVGASTTRRNVEETKAAVVMVWCLPAWFWEIDGGGRPEDRVWCDVAALWKRKTFRQSWIFLTSTNNNWKLEIDEPIKLHVLSMLGKRFVLGLLIWGCRDINK